MIVVEEVVVIWDYQDYNQYTVGIGVIMALALMDFLCTCLLVVMVTVVLVLVRRDLVDLRIQLWVLCELIDLRI